MDHPGLDPSTALQLIQTLLYAVACILGGSVLLGLSAYIVFLCLETLSRQPCSKARLAEVQQPVACAPVTEENLELAVAGTPIPAGAESLGKGTVPVPVLAHDAQQRMTSIPVTLESEPTGPWGFPSFLRFRRAVVPQKRGSSLMADAQLEKLA